MKKLLTLPLSIWLLAFSSTAFIDAAQPTRDPNSDSIAVRATVDSSSAVVQLKGEPLSTYVRTKPAQGKKIDFNSNTVKSYRAQLSALRNDFKSWLHANAPKAKVTSEFDISLNAVSVNLNGTSLGTIRQAPQVLRAEYQNLYHPTIADPDLGLIHAIQAWQTGGGAAHAGEGVKVAIVDTGIDIQHPCFDDTGYPAQNQLGDHNFTNNKVIAAKVFNNKAVSRGYTAEPIQDHGTHVAGTTGCNSNTPAVVNGVSIPYGVSGVAPRVLLGNYNVFPGDVSNARSEDILNALEAAYSDGFDVANMSLGGNGSGKQDLLTIAVDDLDQANMVVAVAAGNSGPGLFTIESPGSAARALAAGASSVPHFVGAPVAVIGNTFGAAVGDFATVSSDLTAPLGVVSDSSGGLDLACSALPAGSLTGKIALISRGTCTFSSKIRNAQNAGAVATLIVNNIAGDPVAMGQDGTPNQPTIPAYMLGRTDGLTLVGSNGASTTISATLQYFLTTNADIMASFSSQGPTDADFRVKPDVVAPGVNVLSSIPVAFCGGDPCWAFFQGTSMATPHLAGSAAIVRWLYPDWSAAQVRSAIVNTADQNVLKNYSTAAPENDVNVIGAGRENLLSAVNAVVALDPVSISFGAVPSGSGQTQKFNLTLNNLKLSAATYAVAVGAGDAGVAYSVSPSSITLNAGQSATVTVTMAASKRAAAGGHQATLTVSSGGGEVAHAAVYALIK
jgi:minor extracellular serine protease Vpr